MKELEGNCTRQWQGTQMHSEYTGSQVALTGQARTWNKEGMIPE